MSFSGCEDRDGGESISVLPVETRKEGKSGVVSKAIDGDIIIIGFPACQGMKGQ